MFLHKKKLETLTEHWECAGCEQRFNRHDNYNRHVTENLCSGGKTKLICHGGKFQHIMNSSEKIFYGGNTQFSYIGCRWIEKQSEVIGTHIHHALCGHGGERCILIDKNEVLVDGYEPKSKTVYQFHGCKWHGCSCLGSKRTKRDRQRYQETLAIEAKIKGLGYKVVSVWEHEKPQVSNIKLEKNSHSYPYFIVYDFEALLNKLLDSKKTDDLSFNTSTFLLALGLMII